METHLGVSVSDITPNTTCSLRYARKPIDPGQKYPEQSNINAHSGSVIIRTVQTPDVMTQVDDSGVIMLTEKLDRFKPSILDALLQLF